MNPISIKDYASSSLIASKILEYDNQPDLVKTKLKLSEPLPKEHIEYFDPTTKDRFAIREYNYSGIKRLFDMSFDPKNNLFIISVKVKFVGAFRALEDNTGNPVINSNGDEVILPYDSTFLFNSNFYQINDYIDTNATWINESNLKQKVETILNSKQYYFVPKNCSKGSCTCKIPVKFELIPDASAKEEIYVYELATRADSGNWAIDQALEYKTTPNSSLYSNDLYSIISSGQFNPQSYSILNWTKSPKWEMDNVCAHETGHLYGWPDEYFAFGGAIHPKYVKKNSTPPNQIDFTAQTPDDWQGLSATNLMGEGTGIQNPLIQKYYLYEMRDWFEKQTGISWDVQ